MTTELPKESPQELPDDHLERIEAAIKAYHPSPNLETVREAFSYSSRNHEGQVRASGEPYLLHLIETALLVCRLKLDVASVVAALLHDTLEDCQVCKDEIEKKFGSEVSEIVEGVTKLSRIEFESREEKQAESFRKMLLAMAKDIRVVLVKLCDRLHNMRTLFHLPEEKRRKIAQETLDIYAPLANRLGIHWLKSELEDLCLLHLRPEIYELIKENLAATRKDRERYVQETAQRVVEALEEAGISGSVKGRFKHFFSIWQKMEKGNIAFDEVHDLHGFRIIVPTLRACYETLGVIHAKWRPVPGRFKDYIAMPKPNMYQSLHTTVIGPAGKRIEIQIRTAEMNRIAEEGIAAHWRYKEPGISQKEDAGAGGFDLKWVKDLVESQQYLKNPDEFIQSVKGELFPEEVFVFTPKGDLIRLSASSTPVDFAYAVHTDVGHRTTGARVNGLLVPLDYELENGDTIEIITSNNHVPSKDWLGFVKSSKAKQRIRAFVKSQEQAKSFAIGMEMLAADLRKVKKSLKKLEKSGEILKVANDFGLRSEGELYGEIGYGKIGTSKVLAKLLPDVTNVEEKIKKKESPLERIFQRVAKTSREKVGVKVSGIDDMLVRFGRCCEPLPGDRIIGFITRGRGVTVHRADCSEALNMDPQRRIEVSWDIAVKTPRRVRITVHSQDSIGLLSSVTQAITAQGANIFGAQVKTNAERLKALIFFELAIEDARQLDRLIRAIEMVPGVIRVERVRKMHASLEVEDE